MSPGDRLDRPVKGQQPQQAITFKGWLFRSARTRRRFGIVLVAVGTWATFSFAVDGESWGAGRLSHSSPLLAVAYPTKADGTIETCIGKSAWTIQNIPQRGWFKRPIHTGVASFDLPMDASLYYFLSRGSLSHGNVRFLTPDHGLSNKMRASVRATYRSGALFDATAVCLMEREGGEHGIGIFTPDLPPELRDNSHEDLVFEVIIHLPRLDFKVKRLETHLPGFSHHLDDLSSVEFGSLEISSSHGDIKATHLNVKDKLTIRAEHGNVQLDQVHSANLNITAYNASVSVENSLSSEQIFIQTTRSSIDGSFQSPNIELVTFGGAIQVKSLLSQRSVIRVSNGKILGGNFVSPDLQIVAKSASVDVDTVRTSIGKVHTSSSGGWVRGHFESDSSLEITASGSVDARVRMIDMGTGTGLVLDNTNGGLNASVSLISGSDKSPHLNISANKASWGHLKLRIDELPADSVLTLDCSTAKAPISVVLPATYEGSFDLASLGAFNCPKVKRRDGIEDPSGRGRHRSIETNQVGKSRLAGAVRWEDKQTGDKVGSGKIVLTSNEDTIELVL